MNGLFAQTEGPAGTGTRAMDALISSFNDAFREVAALAPKVLAMILVLVIGYIVATLVARFISALCARIGLQTAAQRSGMVNSMQQVGIRRTVPDIIGTIVFWLLMCVFLMAAFNILGLPEVSDAMRQLVDYIPRILVATAIVVIGLLVASLIRGVVATSADRVGVTYAEHLANGCYYVLALLTFMAAFERLGIEFVLLEKLILIAAGSLAVAFALSFGLGGRDVMAGILAGYYLRQRLEAGDQVHVAGMEGTVREVGAVATIIETEEGGLLNRHSVPNVRMLNEAVR